MTNEEKYKLGDTVTYEGIKHTIIYIKDNFVNLDNGWRYTYKVHIDKLEKA